ncbi:hypothetical protein Ait01nite_008040 [Actinoplanes italicus]|uniref:PPE family protein n=1 Tax=Actinoplanes italicus TaxID=113567 RepID=A0A2T0KLK7_9ACTN|nr:hypothetical protein [Actinoplanes italicus]PRX24514.1 hypothetical protein CLV67_102291 [Actinoplanes italicus]GIE27759.1 hypothetical protein Ait01nite_008040 [Actinoplanes italicus]
MPLYDGGGAGDSKDRFYFMDVPNMWDMLQYHDSAPHQQALQGWRQSYELVLMHKAQVEKYKEKLITAWPPERSKAARAYVERLDHLIESLNETFEAAIANYTAYSTAIAAVDDAKRRLESLKREHDANADALTKYAEEMRDRPRAYGKAVAPPPPPSPVADGRQEQLRLQAAGLMTGLSAELATAQMSLTAPRPYNPNLIRDDANEAFNPGGISPLLPGGMPSSGRTTTSAQMSRPRSSGTGVKGTPTERNNGKTDPSTPGRKPVEGPVLGGTKQTPAPLPAIGPPPGPNTFTPSINAPDSLGYPPPQSPPSSTTLPRTPTTNSAPFGTVPPTAGTRGTSPLHGGLIGGTPPMGGSPSTRGGQLGASTRGGQRINPIGGMIGQEAMSRPGQRSTSRRSDDNESQRWDPDNPWETGSGMDPVLLPASEQRIDPGPTIGGR